MSGLIRILLIDNYDSYTYNLKHLFLSSHCDVVVVHNDDVDRVMNSCRGGSFHGVVISPGPGLPSVKEDFRACSAVIQYCVEAGLPLLGVCLGHQGIATAFGVPIVRLEEPAHGVVSLLQHTGDSRLFQGALSCDDPLYDATEDVPRMFEATRYHSWTVDPAALAAATALRATATVSGQAEVQALEHASLPIYGVQFHPESICTPIGAILARRFAAIVLRSAQSRGCAPPRVPVPCCRSCTEPRLSGLELDASHPAALGAAAFSMCSVVITLPQEGLGDWVGNAFSVLVGRHPYAFCLDSARKDPLNGRYSIFGAMSTSPSACILRYSVSDRSLTVCTPMGVAASTPTEAELSELFPLPRSFESTTESNCDIFEALERAACQRRVADGAHPRAMAAAVAVSEAPPCECFPSAAVVHGINKNDISFDFHGGFLGYIGYDCRSQGFDASTPTATFHATMAHLCQGLEPLESNHPSSIHLDSLCAQRSVTDPPSAFFYFVDRFFVVDHHCKTVTASVLVPNSASASSAKECYQWLSRAHRAVSKLLHLPACALSVAPLLVAPVPDTAVAFRLDHDVARYCDMIKACLLAIQLGESYELCLTNKLRSPTVTDPFDLFSRLRTRHPAPFTAFISCDWGIETDESAVPFAVVSSSPEKFMSVKSSGVQAKPIKGTARRGATSEQDVELLLDLLHSQKDRSENLMIVDLLRNDMNRFSVPGSVCVPRLMSIESYATVHQMVSTIESKILPGVSPIQSIYQSFPGGSMTGAPKPRSMQILHSLERTRRGVYSGCLGYISASGGASNLSIVIRTAVITPAGTTIGCGGAIVARSDVSSEVEEMLLKAKGLLSVISSSASIVNGIGAVNTPVQLHSTADLSRAQVALTGLPLLSHDMHLIADPLVLTRAEDYLQSLSPRGMTLGLEGVLQLLRYLGYPHRRLRRVIHVTGTNGKGSVVAMIARALSAQGFRVGSFASPHLTSWRSLVQVNGVPVSEYEFDIAVDKVRHTMKSHALVASQFEVLWCAVVVVFASLELDFCVVEVGLGGDLDATNVFSQVMCSVITSIGLDHCGILGFSCAEIARHKAGIVKPGCPVVVGPGIPPDALAVIEEVATAGGSRMIRAPVAELMKSPHWSEIGGSIVNSLEKSTFNSDKVLDNCLDAASPVYLKSNGVTYCAHRHAVIPEHNTAVALHVLQIVSEILSKDAPSFCRPCSMDSTGLAESSIRTGLMTPPAEGRMQWVVWHGRPMLLDGAHNPAGASVLSAHVERFRGEAMATSHAQPRPVHWVVGMLSSKDAAAWFRNIHFRDEDSITFVPVHPNVSWLEGVTPNVLASKFRDAAIKASVRMNLSSCVLQTLSTLSAQCPYTRSKNSSTTSLELVVVTGSLHLVGEVICARSHFSTPDLLETLLFVPPTIRKQYLSGHPPNETVFIENNLPMPSIGQLPCIEGFAFLDAHLRRLVRSAAILHYSFSLSPVLTALQRVHNEYAESNRFYRVRLTVNCNGEVSAVASTADIYADGLAGYVQPPPVRLCPTQIPRETFWSVLFRIKTTARDHYDAAIDACKNEFAVSSFEPLLRASLPNDASVIYEGYCDGTFQVLTEGAISNCILIFEGVCITPISSPVLAHDYLSSALLPVLRGCALDYFVTSGWVKESMISTETLSQASSVWILNSVRGLMGPVSML